MTEKSPITQNNPTVAYSQSIAPDKKIPPQVINFIQSLEIQEFCKLRNSTFDTGNLFFSCRYYLDSSGIKDPLQSVLVQDVHDRRTGRTLHLDGKEWDGARLVDAEAPETRG
jgi:hypothetical protein